MISSDHVDENINFGYFSHSIYFSLCSNKKYDDLNILNLLSIVKIYQVRNFYYPHIPEVYLTTVH